MFNSLNGLAKKSLLMLSNPSEARKLADEQFNYTNENYNIEKNILVMEELYHTIFHTVNPEK